MKAVVFDAADGSVRYRDVDLAPPRADEVRVRIAAAGVCHSDLHVRRREWLPPSPMVMGHEGSGVVVEVGASVRHLAVGDHVVLSWVAPCLQCANCLAGREARCAVAANVVAPGGVLHDGTSRLSMDGRTVSHYLGVSSFAEEVVVPASGAIRISAEVPLDIAALFGCAVATGVGSVLHTAHVPAGATVAVIGCGGVGLNVVQGARLAGASRIIAVDLRSDKTLLAAALGATDRISGAADAAAAIRELLPEGVDYVFDAIGAIATTEQSIRALATGGTAVIVGLPPAGAKASFEPLQLAEAELSIIGSNYGSVRPAVHIPELVELYLRGTLQVDLLVSSRRPLAQAAEALDDLQSGSALRTLLLP